MLIFRLLIEEFGTENLAAPVNFFLFPRQAESYGIGR